MKLWNFVSEALLCRGEGKGGGGVGVGGGGKDSFPRPNSIRPLNEIEFPVRVGGGRRLQVRGRSREAGLSTPPPLMVGIGWLLPPAPPPPTPLCTLITVMGGGGGMVGKPED